MPRYTNVTIINKIEKEKNVDLTMQGLGLQLTQEKLKNIQKDSVINGLGQQLTDLKLQLIKIQGGTK